MFVLPEILCVLEMVFYGFPREKTAAVYFFYDILTTFINLKGEKNFFVTRIILIFDRCQKKVE